LPGHKKSAVIKMTTRFYWTRIDPIGWGCRDWKQCLEGIPLI